ncbi:hypothetical protein MPTK1_4g18250 [Marchantia polymorpha subsp. ruderalis]|uniref:F-box domain-containing protein n=2 Tax=Marchantia polymorpha TaxID=3197 RepID=A0AAF6BB70_MARPO|nr:hypothetical protein MARPO_0041s0106 [Marchantia polymorpha]BBN09254.1 hypothetical protein Mp_4g18250 [Marchantia polymorpha subsp. ruderalis]|eukprot:PTQ40244.1 hypothetical protein MARPO_0041s0106 [Marchantia polymorpha]
MIQKSPHTHHPSKFVIAMVLETEESRPEEPWDTLPIDFLMKILRDHGLPVSTLVACRVVCKKWKEIVDGPDFRSKIWHKCVIVYDARTDGTAHFCCRNQWITKNITFPPKELVASDGGLLCFNEELSTEFVMYDPVPDKFLTLNVPYEIDGVATVLGGTIKWILVGLAVDKSTKSFKLLLGGVRSLYKLRSLMYDSTIGTWSWLAHRFPLSEAVMRSSCSRHLL